MPWRLSETDISGFIYRIQKLFGAATGARLKLTDSNVGGVSVARL